jgi:hypothetical protein
VTRKPADSHRDGPCGARRRCDRGTGGHRSGKEGNDRHDESRCDHYFRLRNLYHRNEPTDLVGGIDAVS